MRLALVAGLIERGFDVLSVHQVGPKGVDDALVLERAIELGRVLITHNADDFKAVHTAFRRADRPHFGVVCVPQRGSLGRRIIRVAMMLDWIGTQPYTSRLFQWGQLQRLLEQGFRPPGYSEAEVREALGQS